MSDLIQRLRNSWAETNAIDGDLLPTAADEIERLTRERDEAVALLKEAREYVEDAAWQLGNPKRNFALDLLARIDALLKQHG